MRRGGRYFLHAPIKVVVAVGARPSAKSKSMANVRHQDIAIYIFSELGASFSIFRLQNAVPNQEIIPCFDIDMYSGFSNIPSSYGIGFSHLTGSYEYGRRVLTIEIVLSSKCLQKNSVCRPFDDFSSQLHVRKQARISATEHISKNFLCFTIISFHVVGFTSP
ncbi:MAG: hypothetical protein J5727_10070 [Kiritimatiellae bacterium]|nr:hypothetical protein [Kiritimatiellia bacterium]